MSFQLYSRRNMSDSCIFKLFEVQCLPFPCGRTKYEVISIRLQYCYNYCPSLYFVAIEAE